MGQQMTMLAQFGVMLEGAMDLYVVPTNVVFSALTMRENVSVGFKSGYFANEVFSGIWNHTASLGAAAE